ncbi:pyroglutamyl peptidase-like protein type I [Plenodomus tracheiphilus IPT5]|uniref:Pyroglutamyl peptidase-like protein type I n=1 Tax=Plenodomus tracheiphilus IPT5 TaxID=1408161 RepID=A0A6A7B1M3_9PLEO|nr:pyroglutamyl peptidase-like protein type I [Plenodomus tracheiphilus IPT5]
MPPAAYAARQPPSEEAKKPVTVLVTGFGPFLDKVPNNPSWGIASRLPALIPASPADPTPIHIHVHHEAIRVAYQPVVDLVPRLLPPNNPMYPSPNIILHIGLAAGRDHYAAEEGAWGRNYAKIPDVDGEGFPDDAMEKLFPTKQFPVRICTSFDTSDVLTRWRANLNSNSCATTPDVRISQDPGNFLCGFIYYNSLAHYYSLNHDERPVMFLHVPDISRSEDEMKTGLDVTLALIKALVQSYQEVGVLRGERNGPMSVEQVPLRGEVDNNFSTR